MARSLVWVEGGSGGWTCSNCQWKFPIPTFLSEKEARDAYDRLAAGKFNEHQCEVESSAPAAKPHESPTFAERTRVLIMRGYRPKPAIELVLQEIELEQRNNPAAIEKARAEAKDFLLKIGKGLI